MREKGVEPDKAILLLSGLPDTFDQWKSLPATSEPIVEGFKMLTTYQEERQTSASVLELKALQTNR